MELKIENLSKRYDKDKYGIKNFSIEIGTGVLGLLGPNGAGKSTLLRMIATVTKPTGGIICLNKNNILKDPNYMRKKLGYLPQDFGVYPNLNAYEFLKYLAAMKGVGGKNLSRKISSLLTGLNLMEVAKKPIGTYSGGMKQRIGIAQVLLNDPKVVIFDEPTVGLDPEERVRFRNLISDLAQQCIVILSSHIVSDIDTISDNVAIMKNGLLLANDNQENIIRKIQGKVYEVAINKNQLQEIKEAKLVVSTALRRGKLYVRYICENPIEGSLKMQANLEDAYLYLAKDQEILKPNLS